MGASALHSGGGFGSGFGGFDKEVIYDPICDEWRGVTINECPIAFNFRLYEPLCNAGTWWGKLRTRTEGVWFIKPFGNGLNYCENTAHFACPILGRSCPSWLRGSSHGTPSFPWTHLIGNPGNRGNNHGNQGPDHGSHGNRQHSWLESLVD